MSELVAPTKPPRGNKSGKETGILMTVIKTLSSSASTDHRDREKSKLEKEYRRSDQRLEELVAKNQQSLNSVMHTFKNVCGEIDHAKTRLQSAKGNLLKCKMLLHCRREELQRLWLEGIEHKHALDILNQIDTLRSVPDQYNKAMSKKHYVHAAEILMKSLEAWNENLDKIEGLKDMHNDLSSKKHKLYGKLKEDLYSELYSKWSWEMKRQGSGLFQRSSSDRRSSGRNRMNHVKSKRVYLDVTGPPITNPSNPQEMEALFTTIVATMELLKELPKFTKDLKSEMEEKLFGVVNNTSQQIIEFGDSTGDSDSSLLSELLKVTFDQFRWIVRSHVFLLRLLNSSVSKGQLLTQIKLYTEEFVWGKVQHVLSSTLKIYFDLSDSKNHHSSSMSTEAQENINTFFAKKRQPRQKKVPLFKFEYSLHGLNIDDFLQDDANGPKHIDSIGVSMTDKHLHRFLVSKPNSRNILVVYDPVQSFVQEIEESLGGKCELRKFMSNNVNRVYVQQIYKDISESVEASKKNPDAWRDVISLDKGSRGGKVLLSSVVGIGRSVGDVEKLAIELPSHSDSLLRILEVLLTSFRDSAFGAYASLADEEGKGIISNGWVKDDDISRLLRSLPNWKKLKSRKEDHVGSESPEELRAQNMKESDLLCTIFGGKTIQLHEIISDTRHLEHLAHFHESMEWFSECVQSVVKRLGKNIGSTNEPESLLAKIEELANQFVEVGDFALLLLHLEVRVHSLYYLGPLAKKAEFAPGTDSQAPDNLVTQLTKDIGEMESVFSAALQPFKIRYIFEGLGELIASVLISGAQDMKRINENGVKKACRDIYAIQQTLCAITNQPEAALDHARQFFELFILSPDELVEGILEKGPQFKEMEYMNALKLLFRSKPGSRQEAHNETLTRLSNILGDVGVTV